MSEAKWLILLDHTVAAKHVIPSLQKAGFKILFVGTDPALQTLSDDFIDANALQSDFLDQHFERLQKLNAVGVYTLLEHAKNAEVFLSTALGLPSFAKETLTLSRSKVSMRRKLSQADPRKTIRFQFIEDSEPLPAPQLNFPFIVKPNSGYASGGVQLVKTQNEYEAAVKVVRRLNLFVLGKDTSAEAGTLCEEFITGPEFSIDAITVAGETHIFCICGRGFVSAENFQDYLYFTSPSYPPTTSEQDLKSFVTSFLANVDHANGPSHTEVRYDLQGQRWVVLESGLRVGFAGNIGKLVEEATSIPYNALAARAHLGLLPLEELRGQKSNAKMFGFVFTPATGSGGKIKEIAGIDFLNSDPRIRFSQFLKSTGDIVVPYPKGLEYLGVIIGVETSSATQMQLSKTISEKVSFLYA